MLFFLTEDPAATLASRAAWFIAGVLIVLGGVLLSVRLAAEEAERARFDLPAGAVAEALQTFSEQSGRSIVVPTDLVQGIRSRAVAGEFTPGAALASLLADTPLAATEDGASGAFAIVRKTTLAGARPRLNAQAAIIVGLAAEGEQADRLRRQAEAAREALAVRGIPPESIQLVPARPGGPIRADMIVAALRAMKADVDETWVLLLGNVAPGREGQPMLQVNGPRLSADDLAAAIAGLAGRRLVVVATSRSGGFLPPLQKVANVEAVAATAAGELSEPRFADGWVEALRAEPGAAFRQLARVAAARVAVFYREKKLVQTEHAQVIDGTGGRIVAVEP